MRLKAILMLTLAMLLSAMASAQMTFSFSGGTSAKYAEVINGTNLVTLPADAPLGKCITGVWVDGKEVDASAVTPDPTKVEIRDGEIEVFVYDGKAYCFRFYAGGYFTVVMFGDVHIDESRECLTTAEFANFANDIIKMGKDGGKQFSFSKAPKGYVPTADLVMCLGDMDKDNQDNANNGYVQGTALFGAAGIPFVDMVGNHDMVPDRWTGENGDYGLTSGTKGGSNNNNIALNIVTNNLNAAKNNGVEDVTRFTDRTSHTQAQPYAFKFNGVRFYVGQTYWFQKPYSESYTVLGSLTLSKATYYKPDGVISALDSYVDSHKDEPSIWTQHYPFVFGSDCDRWWLDQNDVGKTLLPTDNGSSAYPGTESKYDTDAGRAAAKIRKDALATIINKTKNPVHFTGHVHEWGENTYNGIKDYSVASAARHKGSAFIVLCKAGVGFVECKQVTFSY